MNFRKTIVLTEKIFTLLALSSILFACNPAKPGIDKSWEKVDEILAQIQIPVFKTDTFNIVDFGAVADGQTLNTEVINKAIIECSQAGGGVVLVPQGVFLTGAVHLKSNVNLHIAEGATLLFSRDPNDYLPLVYTRFEGNEVMNYSPLIYAFEQENIGITGKGTLDGNANKDFWWPWKGPWSRQTWETPAENQLPAVATLRKMAEDGVHVSERIFGEGQYLRPNFVQPYLCKNVLIDGFTIINSPMWVIHPVLSENVTISNVSVNSHGPNNDGCNPESCKNVLIKNCQFNTGDDCIAIKSGRGADGHRIAVPAENIVIQGCEMRDGHGGVVMGSEISGGCKYVFAENLIMDSPNLDRVLRIKTNSVRGGTIENIFLRNIEVGQVREAIVRVNFYYEEGDAGVHTPIVRNVYLQNIKSNKSKYALYLKGYERSPITGFVLEDCSFNGVTNASILEDYDQFTFSNVFVNNVAINSADELLKK